MDGFCFTVVVLQFGNVAVYKGIILTFYYVRDERNSVHKSYRGSLVDRVSQVNYTPCSFTYARFSYVNVMDFRYQSSKTITYLAMFSYHHSSEQHHLISGSFVHHSYTYNSVYYFTLMNKIVHLVNCLGNNQCQANITYVFYFKTFVTYYTFRLLSLFNVE